MVFLSMGYLTYGVKKFMNRVGVRLKELRGTSSQAEMASGVGVKQQNWARWESGTVTPSVDMIIEICRVHACSADWLLGLKDNQASAGSVKASSGGIAIGGVGNRVTGTIVTGGDAGHAAMCKSCPYKKWGEKLRKQGLVIPGVA